MARPVTSTLSVQNVLCSDGVKRTFRYYSQNSTAGTVRVNGVQVTGDIRRHQFEGYVFVANPSGMNYNVLPQEQTTNLLWEKINELCKLVSGFGIGNPDPMMIARFLGLNVNEEEGWVDAPLPVPYDDLSQGSAPPD